jgi:serine/threonine protein kinase
MNQAEQDQLTRDMIDSSELVMLNNKDFFSDDIYDYKETFLQNHEPRGGENGHANKAGNNVYNVYDMEEDDEDDFDDFDVSHKSNGAKVDQASSASRSNRQPGGNDEDELADEDAVDDDDFRVKASHFNGEEFLNDDDDENNEGAVAAGETFFKRVDSMDLVKPKKTKIIDNYLIGELLGDGSYGKVKECLDMSTLARRAVKIINLKMVNRKIPRGVENVRKEIRIMKRLEHRNVIKLYGTFEKGSLGGGGGGKSVGNTLTTATTTTTTTGAAANECQDELLKQSAAMVNLEKPPKLYIFMDYCITSLEKLLKNAPDQRLRNYQASFYFRQLVDGLEYLHSLNIIHNDIKPGNLLITCDDILKICDFSVSADLGLFPEEEYANRLTKKTSRRKQSPNPNNNSDHTNPNEEESAADEEEEDEENEPDLINPNLLCGNSSTSKFPISHCTPMFQCPEMLDESMDELAIIRHATKIDIWSSGITLYQLTTGDLPFKGQTLHQIFELIRSSTHLSVHMPDFVDKNLVQLLHGMLARDPVARFTLKQIRDSEWFKKKHPIIKDELAILPVDVCHNELTSTFRMLNYLDKYCQPYNERAGVAGVDAVAAAAAAVNGNAEEMAHFHHQASSSDSPQASISRQHNNNQLAAAAAATSLNNNASNNITNNQQCQTSTTAAASSTNSSKKYNQAVKVKRNHCDLM